MSLLLFLVGASTEQPPEPEPEEHFGGKTVRVKLSEDEFWWWEMRLTPGNQPA